MLVALGPAALPHPLSWQLSPCFFRVDWGLLGLNRGALPSILSRGKHPSPAGHWDQPARARQRVITTPSAAGCASDVWNVQSQQ